MGETELTISAELQAQIDQARLAGEIEEATEPHAVQAWYEVESQRVFMELKNGVVIGIPKHLLQGLGSATVEELSEVEISPRGYGLHWESLDVDLPVPRLAAGIFGTKAWMQELGRRGGQVKSAAKAKASRENGKRGGRPRKAKTSVFQPGELDEMRQLLGTNEHTSDTLEQQTHQSHTSLTGEVV